MASLIDDFIYMSKYAGMREDLVQAGGGNSSVKLSPQEMLIKASGFQMADISQTEGYAAVDPRVIVDAFNAGGELPADAEKTLLESSHLRGPRPSIETFLHSVTDVLTLHTHPMVVNILAMRKNGMDVLQRMFPDALIVGYETPGIKLAQKYFSALFQRRDSKNCSVIFLKNHGMIVTGKTAEEVIGESEDVLKKIEDFLGLDMAYQHNSTILWKAFRALGMEGIVRTVTDVNVMEMYRNIGSLWRHEFCPDCLVYCGKRMLTIPEGADLVQTIRAHQLNYGPVCVLAWKNMVYIHAANVRKAMDIQSVLSFSAQVMQSNREEECDYLSEGEQNFLLHWDAEKYRKTL